MNEKLQHNPKNKENMGENQKFSSLLKTAKKIYEKYKRINESYNKKKITNIQINQKFKLAEKKYLALQEKYENIKNPTKEKLNNLKQEVENMKIEYRKYEWLSVIGQIQGVLEEEDKKQNWEITKTIKKLWLWNSIDDLSRNKDNLQKALNILKKKTWKIPEWENEYNYIVSNKNQKLTKAEKSLYADLDPIKNYFKYMEDWWVKLTKKDLTTTLSAYKEEYKIQSKLYEENYKKYQEQQKQAKNKQNIDKNIDKNTNWEKKLPFIFTPDSTYNPNSWILLLKQENTIKPIKIPEHDRKILNSDNIENYSQIINSFEKAWIPNLIKYLPQISSAIWWNVNYNDDFLKENELKQVLNAILISTWYSPIDIWKKLKEFINIFSQNRNKKQAWWWYKNKTFEKWISLVEEKFLDKFVNNKTNFKDLFINSIKTQKNPT